MKLIRIGKMCPTIILNGQLDVVVELQKKDWFARAYGIVAWNSFFGFIRFIRKLEETN